MVLDLYARRVVGWAMSSSPDADLVVKALDHAWEQCGRPEKVMFHSDQGSQYASRKFRQRLWRYRMTQSMIFLIHLIDLIVMKKITFH